MEGKTLKQLQALEKRKKEKVQRINEQLKCEKATLAQLKEQISVKKKKEADAKKKLKESK